MSPDIAVDLVVEALQIVMLLVMVLVIPGLVMGLVVALFQAATQINEQTLSFLPRLLVTLLAVILAGHWMTTRLMDYCVSVFQRAATLVGWMGIELFGFLMPLIGALWWPFCRIMAMMVTAPVMGDGAIPVPVRALLAIVLSFLMLPLTTRAGMATPDPFSLSGVVAMFEQAVIGGVLGLALQFAMAAVTMLGFLASSQIGFSMAQMNDPVNGQVSDVISGLMSLVAMLVFFAIDGHLVLVAVLGQSFHVWPVGSGVPPMLLEAVALNVGWVFAAAVLLALPIVFSTIVVQMGFGFLNRVAPSLNLFSLGFALVTIFGLLMLIQLVRFIPEHYVSMTNQVLEMLTEQMRMARGG